MDAGTLSCWESPNYCSGAIILTSPDGRYFSHLAKFLINLADGREEKEGTTELISKNELRTFFGFLHTCQVFDYFD